MTEQIDVTCKTCLSNQTGDDCRFCNSRFGMWKPAKEQHKQSTMTAREQLELAAKACGIEGYEWDSTPFSEGLINRNFEDSGFEIQHQFWNPSTDQSDSDRMGVKLRMNVEWCLGGVSVTSYRHNTGQLFEYFSDHNNDENAALMAARMRCAVAIGEGME